ncbi:MAG: adenosylcobinamide-GDP ribazoletransferase [Coriobacteriia bacterium]
MALGADIRSAFGLLTIAPVPATEEPPTPKCAAWFPWVGLALGGLAFFAVVIVNVASVTWGDGRFLSRGAWPFSVLVIAGWAAATRLLHWDGLADVADGWWGGVTPTRRLEIMADSAVGAFGTATVALVAIAQVAALATLLGRPGLGVAVFAAPVFGRASATFGAWLGEPARPGGLGARVAGRPTLGGIVISSAALALAGASMLYAHGPVGAAWSLFAFLVAAAVPHLISGRFGGITGDVLGASVLVTETVCLMSAALVVSW